MTKNWFYFLSKSNWFPVSTNGISISITKPYRIVYITIGIEWTYFFVDVDDE